MDVLAVKLYLVDGDWPMAGWFGNLAVAALAFALYGYRRSLGVTSSREGPLIAGCALLVGLFFLSVPFSNAAVALAVQLQFNRIFWLLDVVGVVYVGWLLVEGPLRLRPSTQPTRVTPRPAVVVVVALLALTRGGYLVLVERAGQPIVQVQLAETDWTAVMRWASTQPIGTNFLAEPWHASRYGTSVRAASGRDVYLEVVKDTGIAIYSSAIAHRVAQRGERPRRFRTSRCGTCPSPGPTIRDRLSHHRAATRPSGRERHWPIRRLRPRWWRLM